VPSRGRRSSCGLWGPCWGPLVLRYFCMYRQVHDVRNSSWSVRQEADLTKVICCCKRELRHTSAFRIQPSDHSGAGTRPMHATRLPSDKRRDKMAWPTWCGLYSCGHPLQSPARRTFRPISRSTWVPTYRGRQAMQRLTRSC
jgi:hypothetical protein